MCSNFGKKLRLIVKLSQTQIVLVYSLKFHKYRLNFVKIAKKIILIKIILITLMILNVILKVIFFSLNKDKTTETKKVDIKKITE